MSVFYFNEMLKVIEKFEPFRQTVTGVAKQTGCAAVGTAAGGLTMGLLGALVGGILGAVYGYSCSNDYDNLINAIHSMTDVEKWEMRRQIQVLVGSTSVEALMQFITIEANRKKLMDLLSSFVGMVSKNNL